MDIIYESKFYKDGHLRYLKHLKENSRPNETGLPGSRIEYGESKVNPNDLNLEPEKSNMIQKSK